jgi:hypothetical protein
MAIFYKPKLFKRQYESVVPLEIIKIDQPIIELKKAIVTQSLVIPAIQNWDAEILELENYFTGITLPKKPLKLNNCSMITDCSLFIESHIAMVKGNAATNIFLPYLNRIQDLKEILINHKLR